MENDLTMTKKQENHESITVLKEIHQRHRYVNNTISMPVNGAIQEMF